VNDLLTSVAEVSVALAGFSGLFVAFSRSRGRTLLPIERYALLFLLFASLSAVALAILPFVLMAAAGHDTFAPWYCLFPGAALIALASWSALSRLRRTGIADGGRRYPWARRLLIPAQWAVGAAQLAPLLYHVDPYALYALALWMLVLISAVQFIIQIAFATRADVEQ
jgi:hypothetical protein